MAKLLPYESKNVFLDQNPGLWEISIFQIVRSSIDKRIHKRHPATTGIFTASSDCWEKGFSKKLHFYTLSTAIFST